MVSLTLESVILVNPLHEFYGDSSVGVSASPARDTHRVQAAGEAVVFAAVLVTGVVEAGFFAVASDLHYRVGCGYEVREVCEVREGVEGGDGVNELAVCCLTVRDYWH